MSRVNALVGVYLKLPIICSSFLVEKSYMNHSKILVLIALCWGVVGFCDSEIIDSSSLVVSSDVLSTSSVAQTKEPLTDSKSDLLGFLSESQNPLSNSDTGETVTNPIDHLETSEEFYSPTVVKSHFKGGATLNDQDKYSINWDSQSYEPYRETELANQEDSKELQLFHSASHEQLTLFAPKKNEPLQINPLWYEEPKQSLEQNSEMAWGWSLGQSHGKEIKKKNWLDW
ncbi:MAG: hypothetical protein EBR01_06420 [Proteobacteria bacterium]|nr:hypothetical protein [Pseudomonadota bacterium]